MVQYAVYCDDKIGQVYCSMISRAVAGGDRGAGRPPLLLRPVGNLVMLLKSSWSSIPAYTQAGRVLVEKKCYESNFNVSSGNFFTKKVDGGGGEKVEFSS